MNLIIETDLGRDPDDFFAICYLIAAGVNIRCITISPGDPDQVAIARMIRNVTGMDFLIGTSHSGRDKRSSGGVHYDVLDYYKHPREATADGDGAECIDRAVREHIWDIELLVIGPATSSAGYLGRWREGYAQGHGLNRITIQGGFLGYHLNPYPCVHLPKFEGKTWCPTFNLNGDRAAAMVLADTDIPSIRYVCKNVCHTVEFDREKWGLFRRDTSPAIKLFNYAAGRYLERHDSKKFHDPTAAVCHLHPGIADWVKGSMVKIEGGWGMVPHPERHEVIANIDYDALWLHLSEFI